MKKKKKKRASIIVRVLIPLFVLAGGYLAYIWYNGGPASPEPPTLPEPLTHSEDIPPATGFIYNDEPVIESVTRWHNEEQLGITDINKRLPDFYEVLVLDEDINANGHANYLLIHRDDNLPALSSILSDVGFTHVFRDLAVYEVHNRSLLPLLMIDLQTIRNGSGDRLIDQVTAQNGYALLLETYEHDNLYDKPVQLIEIVMIDEDGREISDEIIIYWDSAEAAFKATNTFGAP